ncbi:MAG: aminotransferase class I/II-fold pyridoxal phosphate-dependent enzyme [Lachnospiraceae bacterium]|nr:aminotransferase class I/II-fold pyridoxal phosphate-dependent enzyme [Lachnospiraceae bacterium]
MLTYSFEMLGNNSLYEHLYKCIRRDILNGTIRSGEKLPSKRSFAKNLGVSVITVENAYAQLVAEGYIYSVPKSGYYAAEIKKHLLTPSGELREEKRIPGRDVSLWKPCALQTARPEAESGISVRQPDREQGAAQTDRRELENGIPVWQADRKPCAAQTVRRELENGIPVWQPDREQGAAQTDRRELESGIPPWQQDQTAREEWLADFVNSRMDSGQFPFTIWARLLRGVLAGQKTELMEKAPGMGVWKLRQAIAGYLLQFQGMRVRAEQIIVGAGTEYLYSLLIQLLGRDKVYALENPGYVKIAQVYESCQVKTVYVPMDEKGVCLDELRKENADVMHISPSHHYPTGITTPIGRRCDLLVWANEKEERYIIEDDYDCEFRLAGKSIPSLQSIDEGDKVIYMNTFTKSLTPTIRIGYMVLPETLLKRFWERLGFYSCTVSNFEQYTLAEFISEGYFEKHINRMRNYYRNKRDKLLAVMENSPLASRIEIREADAGLHFLMRVNTKWTDAELVRRAEEAGIKISCLSQYYLGENGKKKEAEGRVIINYSGLEDGKMEPVVEKLYEVWFGGEKNL